MGMQQPMAGAMMTGMQPPGALAAGGAPALPMCVNLTQVCVNLTQVCVNLTQVPAAWAVRP
jgi:hypothetical protein